MTVRVGPQMLEAELGSAADAFAEQPDELVRCGELPGEP